jgi:tetratricopeptide (TPR) repeat protein
LKISPFDAEFYSAFSTTTFSTSTDSGVNICKKYSNLLLTFLTFEIWRKILPANHLHLAGSYHNIGGVYDNMGQYSKALSYLERALDIWQRSLPHNHPNLQMLKRNIEIVKRKL